MYLKYALFVFIQPMSRPHKNLPALAALRRHSALLFVDPSVLLSVRLFECAARLTCRYAILHFHPPANRYLGMPVLHSFRLFFATAATISLLLLFLFYRLFLRRHNFNGLFDGGFRMLYGVLLAGELSRVRTAVNFPCGFGWHDNSPFEFG